MLLVFHFAMRAGEPGQIQTDTRFAAADRIGRRRPRNTARARRRERRAAFARFAVAFSLFLALLVSAFLVGGKVVVDPLLRSVAASRETKREGEIVLALPDRAFCRHFSFDNATAELTAGNVEPCPGSPARKHAQMGFAWGAR